MLSDSMFWRLVWKEYRVQRGLWLAMLVLTPVIQLCVLMSEQLSHGHVPDEAFFVIVFGGAAVFMVGCGATLFATEHETGTFAYQRALPVTAWRVFAAKTGLAIVAGGLLLVALSGLTWLLFVPQQLPLTEFAWFPGLLAVAEVFAWGVFFSLVLRQPLWAALLGLLVPLLNLHVVIPKLWPPVDWNGDMSHYYVVYLPARSVFCLLLLALDAGLAHWWFHGKLDWVRGRVWWPTRTDEFVAGAEPLASYSGERRIGWGRLLWLTWREGRWLAGICLAIYGLSLRPVLIHERSLGADPWGLVIVSLLLAGIALGLSSFTLEQWRWQFRFFAEQGVSPRWVWLSRHAIWLSLLLLLTAISTGLMWGITWRQPVPARDELLVLVLLPLLAYAASQLAAMLIRSPAVAMATALALSIAAGIWMALMALGDVPLIWSVWPLPLVSLFATWLCAPDWITERRGRQFALRLALSLGIPAAVLMVAVPLRRACQIPLVDPGFSVAEFTRPLTDAEQQTLDLYRRAWDQFLQHAPAYEAAVRQERESLKQKGDEKPSQDLPAARLRELAMQHFRPTLQLVEAAHGQSPVPLGLMLRRADEPDPRFFPGSHWLVGPETWVERNEPAALAVRVFGRLLESQAAEREKAERLDEAWQSYGMALDTARRARLRAPIEMLLEAQYLEKDVLRALVARWAVHPQQTHERVTAALQELAEYERQGSGAESAIQHEYVNWQRFLNGDLSAASQLGFQAKPRDEARSFDFLLTLMPWERRRSQRHLSNRTRYELSLMLVTETRAATGRGQWSPDCTPAEQERIAHWGATTLLWGHWAIGSYSHFPADCAGHRHAARIRMALVDWRREHGSLPESLDALVGSYFEKLPSDPWTERPFDYWPQGVPFDVTEPIANEQRRVVLAEGTPFLWSSGRERITVHRAPDGSREYSYARTPIDEAEALARGLLFPIPPPAE